MALGGLITAIDSLGGFACGLAVLPQWIVTASLTVRVARLDQVGPLGFEARVLRRGRVSAVCRVDVRDEGAGGRAVAWAVVTSAVLDRDDLPLPSPRPVVVPMPAPDPGAPIPEQFFAIEPGAGPVTRLELVDRLRNPWGILHGGAIATLADVAATRSMTGRHDGPVASADTVMHFLAPVRVGPVDARARIVGRRTDGTVVLVSVHDRGVDDRLCAQAAITVREVGPAQ